MSFVFLRCIDLFYCFMFKNLEVDKKSKQKLAELEAKKQKLELEAKKLKSSISKKERAEDTKRKLLLGDLLLSKVENGQWSQENLLSELDGFLTRDIDRKLFGLAEKAS